MGFPIRTLTLATWDHEGETPQDLLIGGRLDALLAPKPPNALLAGDPRIVRLVPDFWAAEADYHRHTGFFPIMHVVAVRRTLLDRSPELARNLYDASAAANEIATDRLREI